MCRLDHRQIIPRTQIFGTVVVVVLLGAIVVVVAFVVVVVVFGVVVVVDLGAVVLVLSLGAVVLVVPLGVVVVLVGALLGIVVVLVADGTVVVDELPGDTVVEGSLVDVPAFPDELEPAIPEGLWVPVVAMTVLEVVLDVFEPLEALADVPDWPLLDCGTE